MSSSQFSVDLDHLDEIVARLSGLSGFISERLDGIDDKVAGLTGTGWESAAAQAYAQAHREWAAGARDFVDGIRDITDAARKAHERYSHAINLNYKMLTGG
ncbi:WXG100 family type VII secretion target [Nocardia gipuzkoensis]